MTTNDDRGATLPRAQVIDAAFPLSGDRPAPPGGAGPLAGQAVSDVLGWTWKEGDTKGFLAALTGSFELSEVAGHTEARWTPRGYAIQADLGAVTGGQASLAARARSGIKDSLALLKSLRPLKPAPDPENYEAFRALVRHDLEQILKELESPLIRVPRVDQFFSLLLERSFDRDAAAGERVDPTTVRGHLGHLRREGGYADDQVRTIEEEQVQTSFITLVDWVDSLHRSWLDTRQRIDPFAQPEGGREPFFGPAVVALSHMLAAVAVQVEEVMSALRSVGVQRAELEVLRVPDPDGGSMSLGGLLRWVGDFATFEGRHLIQSAGKDGVSTAFVEVAIRLARFVGNLPRPGGDTGDRPGNYQASLPPGFFSPRVQRTIDELHDHLQEVVRIARPIGRRTTLAPEPPSDAVPRPETVAEPAKPAGDEPKATNAARKRSGQ
jgi:hypothetical protein